MQRSFQEVVLLSCREDGVLFLLQQIFHVTDSAHFAYSRCRSLSPLQLTLLWQASSDLRIKSHPHMHIARSRGLGLQLSPGALGPLPRATGTAQKGDIGVQHTTSTVDDAKLKELVDGWRESWISPNMDVHRLSMWSDPEAGFQVRAEL